MVYLVKCKCRHEWEPARLLTLRMLQQNVYALGGYTSHGYTSSIEQLDLRTNTWVQFSDLPLNVGYFGCSLTHSNQVILL